MGNIRTIERATLKVHTSPNSISWFRTTGWHIQVGDAGDLQTIPTMYGKATIRFGVCRKTENGSWYIAEHIESTARGILSLNLGEEEFFIFSETLASGDWIVNSGEYGWSSNIIDPAAKWCALDWAAPHTHGLRIASA
ncbi:hypothetical protein EON81_07295 [bacterium]|nr:MAG: hypothetical protein EON81_07295 [bacterium]